MTCPLLHDTGCSGCGRKLTGRQKKWCSRKCARTYTANHRWTQARQEAKKKAAWFLCANAAYENGQVRLGYDWCEGFTQKPEVNHVEPCKGKHGTWGCHHHQDNLEVLCRPCHLKVTAEQRKEGKL